MGIYFCLLSSRRRDIIRAWVGRPGPLLPPARAWSGWASSQARPVQPRAQMLAPGEHLASCSNSPWGLAGRWGGVLPGSPPAPGLRHRASPREPGTPWGIAGRGLRVSPLWTAASLRGVRLLAGVGLAACHATRGRASPETESCIYLSPATEKQTSTLCPGGISRNWALASCR